MLGKTYRAIGLMSGTSYDGIDIGLIKTDGENIIELISASTTPYPKSLRKDIERLINGDYARIWEVEHLISQLHTITANSFIQSKGMVDVIGFHGQSILHKPNQNICVQLGNPHTLANTLKTDIVYDFRRSDVSSGGQGAPLVPIFLKAIRPYTDRAACFLNIGGVANICYATDSKLIAFDSGPGNAPLNDVCQKFLGLEYDDCGRIASQGSVDESLLNTMLKHEYFSRPWPKSLDRNSFDLSILSHLKVEDILATIIALISHSVKIAISKLPSIPHEIIVSGGGAHNEFLLSQIRKITGIKITPSSKYNLSTDHLEAYAFAYLAVRSKLGLPISFPSTTGTARENTGGVLVRGQVVN